MRPLRGDRRTPGEFDSPNVLVSNRGGEGRDHLVWPNHKRIESLLPGRDKVLLVDVEEIEEEDVVLLALLEVINLDLG